MNDFIIIGTDTDVGKTTFALLWLTQFGDRYEYWKPVETGESDSARVSLAVPAAVVHPVSRRFAAPVAPPLASRLEGGTIPTARELAAGRPTPTRAGRGLVIETFGGAFSPLNEDELQLALLRDLNCPCILVSSSELGGIGRTLQSLAGLRSQGIDPRAVILFGPRDLYTEEQLKQRGQGILVVRMDRPGEWTPAALRACAERHTEALDRIATVLGTSRASHDIERLLADDRRCVWHPYTSLLGADEPLVCVGAQDEFLELADGRRVIDGISSWWTILHGHRHPPLVEALAQAAHRLDHVHFAGVTHPDAVELAELLLGTMPWQGGRVFYSDNGSTAVEVALKMAYQYWCLQGQPGRKSFVGFEHGYHGDTFGAMAVSRDPVFFGRFEPLLFQAEILPLEPDRLETYLQRHRGEVAGVILEPLVQGAGGMRMHTPAVLRRIMDITRQEGVLFIADEVMTGGGRTGTLWAHQASGAAPDLLCAAKTLTGGIMPLAATLAAPAVVAAFATEDRSQTFFHGHSFTANPLACAVAVCNYRLLLARDPSPTFPVRDGAERMGRFWKKALAPLHEDPRVKEVRVCGSIAAVEIDVPGGYLADAGRQLRHACLKKDVLLRPLGSVLYAMPPFGTSDASLERIAEAMIGAVRELH
jgi:adenosylmethionine-8-amino-7-oxononanoate aminotransferase